MFGEPHAHLPSRPVGPCYAAPLVAPPHPTYARDTRVDGDPATVARVTRPLLSALLMLGATAVFVGMQAVVKLGREQGLSTAQVMFWRTAPGLPILWWSLHQRGETLRPHKPRQLLLRSLLGTLAMGTNFASMRVLSLSQFTTLSLMQPVFVALLAPRFLSERIRATTWCALLLALLGAAAVVAPGLERQTIPLYAAALGLSSALASAFAQMWVRKATADDPAERVVFYFAAFVSLVAGAVALSSGELVPRAWDGRFVWVVLGMAGLGTLGQVLMTNAYSHGEAAKVSIIAYAGIVLSLIGDVLFWQLAPSPLALLGALLVTTAGAALIWGSARPRVPRYKRGDEEAAQGDGGTRQ